ncbi:cupin domain-containing protein [Halomarina litorea]|uniref:cupin domain-containing protein n=1 Tax=Halomarina litorea TaxID=2961595 RepID=UPI0020C537FD|nr:cupin domain-containing protein [Halomarina sp. BCD28]
MDIVNLAESFEAIEEYWSPRLAAELNGQHVKLAKLRGEFDWHHHADADELFLVVDGALTIELRDEGDVTLGKGELCVVPAGVEHRPVATEEARVLLFEPAGTLNTGNVASERTVEEIERV